MHWYQMRMSSNDSVMALLTLDKRRECRKGDSEGPPKIAIGGFCRGDSALRSPTRVFGCYLRAELKRETERRTLMTVLVRLIVTRRVQFIK